MYYWVKTPQFVKRIFRKYQWHVATTQPTIFLTFDDGPHPTATPFVLQCLQQYNAKATFFCIGKNVALYPAIYEQIIAEGHKVGNHTYHHLNGWKVKQQRYIANVQQASNVIQSNLFRPPYGKITPSIFKALRIKNPDIKVIMWDVLSADFDTKISTDACWLNVLNNTVAGSIIVLHDSTKAWPHMHIVLPKILAHFSALGYQFKAIE